MSSNSLAELIDSVDELDYGDRLKILKKCIELNLNIQESSDGSRINLDNVKQEQLKILTDYIQSLINSEKDSVGLRL